MHIFSVKLDKISKLSFYLKLGPFVDSNNDLIASGNMQYTFEELLQKMFDQLSSQLKE